MAGLFGPDWANRFEQTLVAMFSEEPELEAAASGYVSFALDVMRRQQRFEREAEYPSKSYAEAAEEVYFDDGYMRGQYLPGLLLSHFLWPHHFRQLRFFEAAFAEPMRRAGGRGFTEIGVGTGLYSLRALDLVPGIHASAYDISPASVAFARQHVTNRGHGDRYEVEIRNVLEEHPQTCEWLICVELLEHLEDPAGLLAILRTSLAPTGRAFITAAVNAPNADHIYLYRTPGEVFDQVHAAGFALEEGLVAPAFPPRRPGLPVPTVVAMILS